MDEQQVKTPDSMDKILIEISQVKEEYKDHSSITKRLDEIEESFEHRISNIEKDMKAYTQFMDKTSGFCTRLGFYGDCLVIWLRGLWKK